MPTDDPVVIHLIAEGASIAIHGHREPDGTWRFIGTSTHLDIQEDGNDAVRVGGIPWFTDLSQVLPDSLWIKCIPRFVHPELRGWFRDRYEAAKATLPDVHSGDEHDEIFAMLRESHLRRWDAMLNSTPPDQWVDDRL